MRVLLISGNRDHYPSPVVPLGVLCVAASLREAHDVRVLDLCFEPDVPRAITTMVGEFDPEVVAIGMRNLNSNAYNAADSEQITASYREMVEAVRSASKAPIIMGGAGFSLQPKRLLERLGADYGIVGEAERAMPHMLAMLAAGSTPPRILRGEAVIYDHDGPAPIRLRRSATIQSDLDLLPPPARDLVDPRYFAKDGTDNIQTKRGCAFGCTYCDYPDLEGRKVRVRSPQSIADEFLARSKVPDVRFMFVVDSVFNVPPRHALDVCKELVLRGTPLPWACYGTPAAFDDALVKAMVDAGCKGVEVGSDSGTQRMLELLKKPFALNDITRTRELFVEHGLLDSHTFVLGAEDETAEEVKRTLEFVDQLDPDVAVFVVFTEEREERSLAKAPHREAILRTLQDAAPGRSGWVVPELGIRFGKNPRDAGGIGPRWLDYARHRRSKHTA